MTGAGAELERKVVGAAHLCLTSNIYIKLHCIFQI
jgi:hypothetical protein